MMIRTLFIAALLVVPSMLLFPARSDEGTDQSATMKQSASGAQAASQSSAIYQEHPVLAQMVKDGLLPPVEQRLPDDPNVVEPLHGVGTYGGTARVINLRSPTTPWPLDFVSGYAYLFKYSPDAKPGVPHVAHSYQVNDNFTEWTFHLRPGLKWSDGVEFTAANFLLYWKYERANAHLSPQVLPENVTIEDTAVTFFNETGEGRTVRKEVIDDYTIKFTSDDPYPFLINKVSRYFLLRPESPMHFMKQFHADLAGEDETQKLAKDAGFEHWYELYQHFSSSHSHYWSNNQVLGNFPPTLSSYVMVKKTQDQFTWERNPFYYEVDTAGNQLPYIDKVIVDQLTKREIVDAKIIAGEIDLEGFFTLPESIPLYKQYESQGDYTTVLWNFDNNASVFIPNYHYEDTVVRDLFRNKKFRQALSISIDRERINNEVLFGRSNPGMMAVHSNTQWYRPEHETKYGYYDPQQAMQWLDQIGVTDADGDGWREDPNGKDIYWVIEWIVSEAPYGDISEHVVRGWKEIGLNVDHKLFEAALRSERLSTNKHAMWPWHGAFRDEGMFPVQINFMMYPNIVTGANTWWDWWRTDGKDGEEPPAEVKEVYQAFVNLGKAGSAADVKKWGLVMTDNAAENVWTIGTANDFAHPYIVKSDLKNFPMSFDDGPLYHNATCMWTYSYNPPQFYFENRPQITHQESLLPVMYTEVQTMTPVERAKQHDW
jgi:peptide/nickel transport system substrate-binding protein